MRIVVFLIYLLCFKGLLYSELPQAELKKDILFIPNKGQIIDMQGLLRPELLFITEGNDCRYYLKKTGFSLVLVESKKKEDSISECLLAGSRVDFDFLNSSGQVNVSLENPSNEKFNYYNQYHPSGITMVSGGKQLRYKEIYKGIDALFYGNDEKGLKCDYLIRPGAKIKDLVLCIRGAESIVISQRGDLIINTVAGKVEMPKPICYQHINKQKKERHIKYVLQGDSLLTFEIEGEYDPDKMLVIDPWVTYYGGTGAELGQGISYGNNGNIYITGIASSLDFPVSAGAFQFNSAGNDDAFAICMDKTGNMLWATYIGGADDDRGNSISLDGSDNVYIGGYVSSMDFPVTAACFQSVNNGIEDGFILKLNDLGLLQWATYLGGAESEEVFAMVADESGGVIVTGHTESIDFPVSAGAYQAAMAGIKDVFVSSFSETGNNLWSTYLGGTSIDIGLGIDQSSNKDVVVTGYTSSLDFPVSAGAYQSTHNLGTYDVFVTRMDNAGFLTESTYIGGDQTDFGLDVSIDPSDIIYLTGHTQSLNFPVTAGAFQTVYGGGLADVFVVRFDDLSSLSWCTYIGGTEKEEGYSIIADGNEVAISGDTYSLDFPVTACAYQQVHGGGLEDNYVGKMTPGGSVTCLSYLGGAGHDEMHCKIDFKGGVIVITGYTPGSYPVTPGSYQEIYGGGTNDIFIGMLTCSSLQADAWPDTTICSGDTVKLWAEGGTAYEWAPLENISNSGIENPIAFPEATVTYFVTVSDGICSEVVYVDIEVFPLSLADAGNDELIPSGGSVQLSGSGGGSFLWEPAAGLSCYDCSDPVASPSTTTMYYLTVTDENGCSHTDSVLVRELNIFIPSVFTPDGNVLNDLVYVRGAEGSKTFHFQIYDRWGKLVFETYDPYSGWDGTYNGKALDQAVFVFEANVEFGNGQTYIKKGNITLLR